MLDFPMTSSVAKNRCDLDRSLYVSVLGSSFLKFTLTSGVPKVLFYCLSCFLSLITFKVQSHFSHLPVLFHITITSKNYLENSTSFQIMFFENHDPTFSFQSLYESAVLYYAVI